MDQFVEYISYVFIFISIYFEVFLLTSFLEKTEKKNNELNYEPRTTVIVPCFNEEKTLDKTLNSILSLDYPKENLDIIIVNDGSTDNTIEILKKFENNPQIKIFHKENGGKYTALNLGIKEAKTDFVGCLDADSFVEPGALKHLMRHFGNKEIMAVTPSMAIYKPNNLLRHMQKAEYHYGNFMRKALSLIGAIHITPGPFSFFRKEVFEKIGYYKHAYNTEDMEMAMRMQKNCMAIENEPNALVYTVGPDKIRKLYVQRVRWVSGFLGNLIDYREMLFKKKYGNLGIIVLPFVGTAIAMTTCYIFITIFRMIRTVLDEIIKISTVGFTNFHFGHFEWFYINTSTLSILTLTLFIMVLFIITFGQKIVTGRWKLSLDSFYFIFLYSLISPFWLSKAIYNNIRSKTAAWR